MNTEVDNTVFVESELVSVGFPPDISDIVNAYVFPPDNYEMVLEELTEIVKLYKEIHLCEVYPMELSHTIRTIKYSNN